MTREKVIEFLRSLSVGDRYAQAQVYARRGKPGWALWELMNEAGGSNV